MRREEAIRINYLAGEMLQVFQSAYPSHHDARTKEGAVFRHMNAKRKELSDYILSRVTL